jgi:hypothetical protein
MDQQCLNGTYQPYSLPHVSSPQSTSAYRQKQPHTSPRDLLCRILIQQIELRSQDPIKYGQQNSNRSLKGAQETGNNAA